MILIFDQKEYTRKYHREHREKEREYSKQYRKDNPEKRKKSIKRWYENNPEYNKQYYIKNREKIKEKTEQYYQDNYEKMRELQKKYYTNHISESREYSRQWSKSNQDKIRKKRKTNIRFNLNEKIRGSIKTALKGNKNGRHWENLVGYTLKNLKKHLGQTLPNGYCWNDYLRGYLHVDHIIPIKAFVFNKPEDKEFKQCWSLWNLRLLPARQNWFKNDKIFNPILLSLLLKGCDI